MSDFCNGIIGCRCPQIALEGSMGAPVFLIKEQNNNQGPSRSTGLLLRPQPQAAGTRPGEREGQDEFGESRRGQNSGGLRVSRRTVCVLRTMGGAGGCSGDVFDGRSKLQMGQD